LVAVVEEQDLPVMEPLAVAEVAEVLSLEVEY
jgi:hypothetical protein